ncbi:MAG: HDOD domain-containing protein [Verrucomicrobiota bacterium]|nr:HDOD domain-containing protein [Verrucomicrobiota bacterium]
MSQVNYNFLINQIQRDLPTLPTIVNELTTILENPNSSTMIVEDIVTADQCMAAKILRVANTSFFRGAGERVKDVNQAIGNVGFDKVKDVVLNNSVFKLFKNDKEDKFSLTGLWKHSLGVASISREIAKFLGKSWHETAYTCGLVHDIGKVARYKLDEIDETEFFLKDSRLAVSKAISFFSAELVNQSARHDYLGYLLCKNWGLSAWVESVVMWHHEPDASRRQGVPSSDAHALIDIIIMANWLTHYNKFGFSGHESNEVPPDALLQRLNISQPQLDLLIKQAVLTLEETKEFCDLLDSADI